MNQNNLLKAISQLENRISRLERKQAPEVAFYGTYSESISVVANIHNDLLIDTVIMNQGIYFAPEVDGLREQRWIVMSSGLYAISASFFFAPAITQSLFNLYVGDDQSTFATKIYTSLPIGNGQALNIHAGSMVVYLQAGWTFHFTIFPFANTTLLSNTPITDVGPSPLIHIAQLSAGYDPPANFNDWYFEPNEIEPH